jgi:hypothetical protein
MTMRTPAVSPARLSGAPSASPTANLAEVKAKLKDCAYLDLTQLQDGANSDDIAALQQALKMDPPPQQLGVLDAATRKAVHDFQAKMNASDPRFEVDDKVGQQTWAALKDVKGYVKPGTVYLGKQPEADADPAPAAAPPPDAGAPPAAGEQRRIAAGAIMKRLTEADPKLGQALSQKDALNDDQKKLIGGYADQVAALPQKVQSAEAIKSLTGTDLSPDDFGKLTQELAGKLREYAGAAPPASDPGDVGKAKLAAVPLLLQQALPDDPDAATTLSDAISGKAQLPDDFDAAKLGAASDGLDALAGDDDKLAAVATQAHLQPGDVKDVIGQLKGLLDRLSGKAPASADPPNPQTPQLSDDARSLLQQAAGRLKLDPARAQNPAYGALLEKLPTLPGFLQLPAAEQQSFLDALAGEDAQLSQQALIVGTRTPEYGALHDFVQNVVQAAATATEQD